MKKISFNFLNRLEQMVFKNTPDEYAPVSAYVAVTTLIAAFASIIVIFFLQMFNADPQWATVVLSVMFGVAFIVSGYKSYNSMRCLPTMGAKVALGVYVAALFAVCMFLFIWLATWVVIIALGLLVLWIILKVAFPNSSGKKRIRVHYGDGTTEDMEEEGRGILGETYYKGDKGGTHVE